MGEILIIESTFGVHSVIHFEHKKINSVWGAVYFFLFFWKINSFFGEVGRFDQCLVFANGVSLRPFFPDPHGGAVPSAYTVGRGEKTKTIEVHGWFVRYGMIKGNRNSGPLSDCDRAGWVRTAVA